MPNSPKASLVPPLAAPERPGWCCLRCLTRRGINMSGLLGAHGGRGLLGGSGLGHGGGSVGAAGAGRTVGAVTARSTTLARRGGLLGRELARGHVALVDPHLDADAAEGRLGLVEAVVDLRTEGVQRHAT